eukprot:1161605-Pelagomonas_calceolata.AAC.5
MLYRSPPYASRSPNALEPFPLPSEFIGNRISLELGGNAPLIVFDDADLELASAVAAPGDMQHEVIYFLERFAVRNEICTALERLRCDVVKMKNGRTATVFQVSKCLVENLYGLGARKVPCVTLFSPSSCAAAYPRFLVVHTTHEEDQNCHPCSKCHMQPERPQPAPCSFIVGSTMKRTLYDAQMWIQQFYLS